MLGFVRTYRVCLGLLAPVGVAVDVHVWKPLAKHRPANVPLTRGLDVFLLAGRINRHANYERDGDGWLN